MLVCVNARPVGGKPSCGARGAAAVMTAFQQALGARPSLCARVAVTSTGCLGPCFEGPVVVTYPDAVWYAGVTAADAAEIVGEHLEADRPVERLRHTW